MGRPKKNETPATEPSKKAGKAKKEEAAQEKVIKVAPIEFGYVKVTLVGETPLLVKKWSEKAAREMADKQEGKAVPKKAQRDPQKEYRDSMYIVPGTEKKPVYAVHAGGIKKCLVSATRFVENLAKTDVRGAFHVVNAAEGNLIPIKTKGPNFDDQIGRIGGIQKTANHIYRARFDDWECTVEIKYMKNAITVEQILMLFEIGGFSVGLHEFRPERDGTYGMFKVKRA